MADPERRTDETAGKLFRNQVARKTARKLKARQDRGIMFWVGMFGLVGWSIAIPTLAGIALGHWLDSRWPAGFSWTLTLLFAGLMMGCLNAWHWIGMLLRLLLVAGVLALILLLLGMPHLLSAVSGFSLARLIAVRRSANGPGGGARGQG